jgi:hypothetical protein
MKEKNLEDAKMDLHRFCFKEYIAVNSEKFLTPIEVE